MVNHNPDLMDFARNFYLLFLKKKNLSNPKPLDYEVRLLGMFFVLLFRSA